MGKYTTAPSTDTTAAACNASNPDCEAERIATVKLAQVMAAKRTANARAIDRWRIPPIRCPK